MTRTRSTTARTKGEASRTIAGGARRAACGAAPKLIVDELQEPVARAGITLAPGPKKLSHVPPARARPHGLSWTVQMWGWFRAEAARASRMNRSKACTLPESDSDRTFSATKRCRRVSAL